MEKMNTGITGRLPGFSFNIRMIFMCRRESRSNSSGVPIPFILGRIPPGDSVSPSQQETCNLGFETFLSTSCVTLDKFLWIFFL